MSDTHTPGPWAQSDEVEDHKTHWQHRINGKGGGSIAWVTTAGVHIRNMDEGKGEMYANARLIAAAPDLLAALENVRGAADRLYLGNVYDVVLAAIAKAKGEA